MPIDTAKSGLITLPANEAALVNLLQSYGISCSSWGKHGTKSVGDLYHEIESGEARLLASGKTLLREVRVVNIDVLADDSNGRLCRLCETRQVFEDGSERTRNTGTSVAEKVLGAESLESAARRGLRQEIGLTDAVELRALAPVERIRHSDSYPHLQSKYSIYPGFVRLNAEQRDSIVLEERQESKTTYFAWRPI